MARVFSIPTVLRQTSHALIRELLARLGHPDLPIPWDDLAERDVDPIHWAIKTLPVARYDELEGALRTVFDLACGTGIAAIREAAACLGGPAPAPGPPPGAGLYDQAAWAWLHQLAAVDLDGLIHQVEHLAWWRRWDDLPRREPDTAPDTLRRLGAELSALLRAEQGRGRNCTVEPLARTHTRYFFAYPDDYVQNVTTHDDLGRLTPRTFRRTFAVVFAFDLGEGALELYTRLSPRLKQAVEAAFARVVFGVRLGPWARPTYDLTGLKWRATPLPTDPADRVRVSIRQLRLRPRDSQRQITFKADPD